LKRQFSIELIDKIRKPDTGNRFVNGLLEVLSVILYPFIIVGGLLVMVFALLLSIYQRLTTTKSNRQADKFVNLQDKAMEKPWEILTETNKIKLYQQYCGEIRFGPIYLKLKSSPTIETLSGKIFGTWFFCYQNGIFLQQWNSTDKANSNLIFVDTDTFDTKIIRENIPSVLWNIVETGNNALNLICDTGREILTFNIDIKEC